MCVYLSMSYHSIKLLCSTDSPLFMAAILSTSICLQPLHIVQLVPCAILKLLIFSISPAPIVLALMSGGLKACMGCCGCLMWIGWRDSFMSFTCSTSSLPIVLDLVRAGLGLLLDDLNDNLFKVSRINPAPGDKGLIMLGLGGISMGCVSWDISDATVTSFSLSCGSLSVLQQLEQT